jgi:hypothetical protein
MCFVALVNFFVALVVKKQVHGFLKVLNNSRESEKVFKP